MIALKIILIFFISALVSQVYEQVKECFTSKDPVLNKVKDNLKKVDKEKVDDLNFYEGDKSYTINKKNVYICLKDENGEYYNENMLTYVALHELAHSLCDEIGHTPKFHKIFDNLLIKAAKKGIFDPTIPLESNYCGHT
jgi:hypothetical protein